MRIVLIIIVIVLLYSANIKVFSQQDTPVDKFLTTPLNEPATSGIETPANEPARAGEFKETKSEASYKNVSGMIVYTVKQNGDTKYNYGYSLGKAIMQASPNYPADLRAFLDIFIESQSKYQLDEVVEKISKAMPCTIAQEIQGLADALSVNNQGINITYKDLVILNTVVLWKKLPIKSPQSPPAAPTSITPIKNRKIVIDPLSPVTEVSDQSAIIWLLRPDMVTSNERVVVKSYYREGFNFFNRYPTVVINHLDDVSFINVGFTGLITVLSGINEYGVVLNNAQDYNPREIEVIGTTPASINMRLAIESSRTAQEALDNLQNSVTTISQVFVIADNVNDYIVQKSLEGTSLSEEMIVAESNRTIVTNHLSTTSNSVLTRELNFLTSSETLKDVQRVLDIFRQVPFFVTVPISAGDKKISIFNAVYQPRERLAWVLLPTSQSVLPTHTYLRLDFADEKPNGLSREKNTP